MKKKVKDEKREKQYVYGRKEMVQMTEGKYTLLTIAWHVSPAHTSPRRANQI